MKNLVNSNQNREFIKKLCEELQYKEILAWVLYTLLYTDRSKVEWKSETEFFREILSDKKFKKPDFSKEDIIYITNEIAQSNIGHKISENLIKWIMDSVHKPVDSSIIQGCLDKRYIDYPTFLKLKIILTDESLELTNYKLSGLDTSNIKILFRDWRVKIMKSLCIEKCKDECFLLEHLKCFNKYIVSSDLPNELFKSNENVGLLIGFERHLILNKFLELLRENFDFGRDIVDYFVINLHNNDYYNVLMDKKVKSFIIREIVKNLVLYNLDIREYIEMLNRKSGKYKFDFPKYKINLLVDLVKDLIDAKQKEDF